MLQRIFGIILIVLIGLWAVPRWPRPSLVALLFVAAVIVVRSSLNIREEQGRRMRAQQRALQVREQYLDIMQGLDSRMLDSLKVQVAKYESVDPRLWLLHGNLQAAMRAAETHPQAVDATDNALSVDQYESLEQHYQKLLGKADLAHRLQRLLWGRISELHSQQRRLSRDFSLLVKQLDRIDEALEHQPEAREEHALLERLRLSASQLAYRLNEPESLPPWANLVQGVEHLSDRLGIPNSWWQVDYQPA